MLAALCTQASSQGQCSVSAQSSDKLEPLVQRGSSVIKVGVRNSSGLPSGGLLMSGVESSNGSFAYTQSRSFTVRTSTLSRTLRQDDGLSMLMVVVVVAVTLTIVMVVISGIVTLIVVVVVMLTPTRILTMVVVVMLAVMLTLTVAVVMVCCTCRAR